MRTREIANDELKKIVSLVISDEKFEKVTDAVINVFKRLDNNQDYKALKAQISEIEHKALLSDKQYKETALLNVTTLARAAKRMLCANIPTDFENTEDFEKLFTAWPQKLDTPARLVSFVIAVQKRFKETKVTRVKQTKPYSFAQKRVMLLAFNLGCSTYKSKDELRAAFNKGIEI